KNDLLNSADEQMKSGYSGETALSNHAFINGIFGELTLERPIVVTFKGHPEKVNKKEWFGQAYIVGKVSLPCDANNYVSFATYAPNDEGQYRRQKAQFAALFAVMLDDVGVKVSSDRVTLEPSWSIETSSGNYQYGFILAEPLRDATQATNLLDSIIAAGLCDPGANGATARIGRLPVAINGKHDFSCKLAVWNPERRYSVQELVDGLQIEIREKVKRSSSNHKTKAANDDVHIPRADCNPVITALSDRGLYKQPLGDGKHDITCPWVHEHTNQSDQGTAYFEPTETYPIGGFKCMHGHCSDRRVSALYSFLGIEKSDAKHLPTIRIQAGEINRIVDFAERELAKTKRHYQRGGIIVTVSTDPQTKATNVKTLSMPSLTRVLAGMAIWQRFDKREADFVVCDPTERHTKILHDAESYPHLPILNGIARQPYLRADGSIVLKPGYDSQSGMFGAFNPRHFNIPENPTMDHAKRALSKLDDLLSEFAFKSASNKSAVLSAFLTATVRQSLNVSPMFHVNAPQIGSGKSYLCDLITLFATPEKSTPHSFPSDDDEMRKLLLAELLTAPAVIQFDNLTSDLVPHKSLCTAITSENISGRILGQSKTADVSTRTLFLSSGNNVDPVRDMTRRVLTMRLDPRCETPATRCFLNNPVHEVKENRGAYVSAALTLIRSWIIAGRVKTDVKPLNSFDEWSELCRHPLLWLGLVDPATDVFETMQNDPDREEFASFVESWFGLYSTWSTPLKRLADDSLKNSDLKETLPAFVFERDGSINRKKLGWWIKRHDGRVVNGMRIIQDTSYSNLKAALWKIEVLEK
ncbi:MAG: hypothetical protein PHG89_11875, partial [Gallionella sp.]|nr:hypothetical protein [Gallionella sp.]